jgi:radical SAM-linked protein
MELPMISPEVSATPNVRLRIIYTKQGAQRYTGHLDFHRVWERALRRSRLPVAYSQGFHPQARLNLACALPLGVTSRCEVLDVWLTTPVDLDQTIELLSSALPEGVDLLHIENVDLHAPPLQTQVHASEYEATLLDPFDAEELGQRIHSILESPSLIRERREKSYDLRPLIEDLHLLSPTRTNLLRLFMRLSAREAATGRPDEVIITLGLEPTAVRVERTALIFVS